MKIKLFGKNIEPACEYCESGKVTSDKKMILCYKQGVVTPYYSCRAFQYSPIKRIPKSYAVLPEFTQDDFSLDI